MINYKVWLVTIIISMPTFLGLTGSFYFIEPNIISFYYTILFITVVFCSYYTSKFIYDLSRQTEYVNVIKNKKIFYFLYFVYAYYLIVLIGFSFANNFNFTLIRNELVRDQGSLDVIFFGNIYLRMIFDYVFSAYVLFVLFSHQKWDNYKIILVILFILSGVIMGGRFSLYKVGVIFLIDILRYKSAITLKRLIIYACGLFFVTILIQANRFINSGDDNFNIDALVSMFHSLYIYHSIQPAILSINSNISEQFGMLTGLLTPLFMILGLTSPEGDASQQLFANKFYVDGNGYNAFGTSAIYFVPSYGSVGIIIFSLSLVLLCYVSLVIDRTKKYYNVSLFLLYSMFFSSFAPFIWSFSWYLSFILFCFGNKVISFEKIKI